MKSISFYDYGLEDIICHRKTSTIRYNENFFKVGEKVRLIRQNGILVGHLIIVGMQETTLQNLSQEDAIIENWKTLDSLKKRLKFSYPEIKEDSPLIKIQFRLCSSSEEIKRGPSFNPTPNNKEVTLISSSLFQDDQFAHIFKSLGFKVTLTTPIAPESLSKDSCEQKAIDKLKNINANLAFSSSDMIIISNNERTYNISSLQELTQIKTLIHLGSDVTLRTGLALKMNSSITTIPVYRTFKANPNANAESLSELLCTQNNCLLSELNPYDSELISPLKQAIEILLNGGIQ